MKTPFWLRVTSSMSLGFCLLGPLPRALGIISTKPEYETLVYYIDIAAFSLLAFSLLWLLRTAFWSKPSAPDPDEVHP